MIFNYSSNDTGAPVLDGQAGSFYALLKALFHDGFSSVSGATITNTGSLATVEYVGHPYRQGQVITVFNCATADYNVTAEIVSVPDADHFTYNLGGDPGGGPDTGDVLVAPIGWFAAQDDFVNQASFNVGPGVVAVDDSGSTNARVRGFETVSATGVAEAAGTGAFPEDTQVSGGLYIMKSDTADATSRSWFAYSANNYFHLFIEVEAGVWMRFGCGMLGVYNGGDTYNLALEAEESASNSADPDCYQLGLSATPGFYVMRNHDQITVSGNPGRMSASALAGARMGGSGFTYPAPARGGIILDPIMVRDADTTLDWRGYIPGLMNVLHDRPLTHDDTFGAAIGANAFYSGLQLRYVDGGTTPSRSCAIQTTESWYY